MDLPFLAVLVSIVAVVLSQLPPAHSWFDRFNISIELGTSAQLWDVWGNLNFQPYVFLHNKGDVDGLVRNVDIFITGPSIKGYEELLPVQTYFEKIQVIAPTAAAPQIPAKLLKIDAADVWSSYVAAWKQLPIKEQDRIAILLEQADKDFRKNYINGSVWKMDSGLQDEFTAITTSALDRLVPGKYFLLASAIGEDGDILSSSGYIFHLRSSQLKNLRRKIDQYEFGGGVLFPLPQNKSYTAQVEIIPVSDKSGLQKLRERYALARKS